MCSACLIIGIFKSRANLSCHSDLLHRSTGCSGLRGSNTNTDPSLFARLKPAERLSPTPMASPSDWEAKLERKKSQPSHVGPPPLSRFPPLAAKFSRSLKRPPLCSSAQLSKTNAQYHKLFKEVSKDELLRQSESTSVLLCRPAMVPLRFRSLTVGVAARQATRAPCRETSCTRGRCSSPTTGSASTPKSSARTPRFSPQEASN